LIDILFVATNPLFVMHNKKILDKSE